jgi:hypothetical protein
MKIRSVFFISVLFLVAAGYTLLQHNAIQAETIIEKGEEKVSKQTVEVTDSTGKTTKDTLLIVTDTLFIEKPELGIIDTIPFADTLNLTEEHEKQKDTTKTVIQKKKIILKKYLHFQACSIIQFLCLLWQKRTPQR